jgi:hypothetical protein
VYNEVTREAEAFIRGINALTAAHEIGHLFNGEHLEGGLMDVKSATFSDVTLNKIRSVSHP